MDHPYIEVDKIKIVYIEKNKNALKTIFFIPGNSVSKRCWRKQFDSIALSAYRMIAIDFPAHGDSDTAPGAIYTLPGLAELLYKVITMLTGNKPFIIAGLSLGTNIIAEMLAFDIQPSGLVLVGPCIVGKRHKLEQFAKPGTHVGAVFADSPEEKDVLSYAYETSTSREEEDINSFLEDFKMVKSTFRSTLGKSIADGNYNDEIALLQQKNIPCLVVFGKDESIIDPDYLDTAPLPLWNKTIYKIKGASHLVNIDRPEKFNQLLTDFAGDIFR